MNRKNKYYFIVILFLILTGSILYDRIVNNEAYYEKVFQEYKGEFDYFASLHENIFEPYPIGESYSISYTAKGLFWQTCKSATMEAVNNCNSNFLSKNQEIKAKKVMAEIELRTITYRDEVVIFTFAGYPTPQIIYGYNNSDKYMHFKGKVLNRDYLLIIEDL